MKYDVKLIEERRKKVKLIKNITNIILAILIYNILLVLISCMNKIEPISIFGVRAYRIITSSMEPVIKNGDVIIVKKSKEKNIKKNDIITFIQEGETITHRIIEIEENRGQREYITKGDNNNLQDKKVITYESIEGKYLLKIPYLGKFIGIFENKTVFLLSIVIFLLVYLYNKSIEEKKEDRRKKKQVEEKKNKK